MRRVRKPPHLREAASDAADPLSPAHPNLNGSKAPMHNLSEVNHFDSVVTVPDDGVDFRTALSLSLNALQQLTNRTRALYQFLGNLTGSIFFAGDVVSSGSFIGLSGQVNTNSAQINNTLEVGGASTLTGLVTTNAVDINGLLTATSIGCTSIACTSVHASTDCTVLGNTALQAASCTTLAVASTASFSAGIN